MSDTTLTGLFTEEEFLEHAAALETMTDSEYLEHYGTKGMKWGQTKAGNAGARVGEKAGAATGRAVGRAVGTAGGAIRSQVKSAQKNAQLNSASRAADRAARDSSIDASRARVKSGELKTSLAKAKITYKSAKKEIGSREAKKALTAVRESVAKDAENANKLKSGKEATNYVLFGYAPRGTINGGLLGLTPVLDKSRLK